MGRIGVSFIDVEQAALRLQGQGKIPTVDGVRDLLKTGSKTTITQHLKAWKMQQGEAADSLPKALQTLVSGLWERLQQEASFRIDVLIRTLTSPFEPQHNWSTRVAA